MMLWVVYMVLLMFLVLLLTNPYILYQVPLVALGGVRGTVYAPGFAASQFLYLVSGPGCCCGRCIHM